jgi:hypothetical protein
VNRRTPTQRRRFLILLLALVVASALCGVLNVNAFASAAEAKPPDRPSGVKAIGDSHSVVVTWDDPSARDQIQMYALDYKAVMTPDIDPWKRIEIRDITARTWTIPGLTNYQRYKFRLMAQNTSLVWSGYSAEAFATPADATLRDLSVSGQTVAGFSADTLSYTIELPYGTTVVPQVTATTNDPLAGATVFGAMWLPGTTTVAVTARPTKDTRVTRTYKVNFTIARPPDRPTGVKAVGDNHAVVVTWDGPTRDELQMYRLEYKAVTLLDL